MEALDETPEQRGDAAGDLRFAALAVGEAGAVRGVDDRRVRKKLWVGASTESPPTPESKKRIGASAFISGSVARSKRSRKLRVRSGLLRDVGDPRDAPCPGARLSVGSIPFGLLLTRIAGKGDVRDIGSGNIGATNVLRTGSKALAALTLVLDCLKATAAILLAQLLFGRQSGAFAAAGAMIGHLYPVWLRFRGGKGVATLLGILIALLWPGRSSMPPSGCSCC